MAERSVSHLPISENLRRIVVYDQPIPKARPRLGRGRVFTPRTTELAEHRIRETWARDVGSVPLPGPVALHVTVYLRQPASLAKRDRATARPTKRPDIDNFAKTVLDALNGVAFLDDAQVVILLARKEYAQGAPPRWEIAVDALP